MTPDHLPPARPRKRPVPPWTIAPPPPPCEEPTDEPKPRDYVVGYGRPPREHQFKPGRSGNPNGRPKGAKGVRTTFQEILLERVTTTVNGRRKRQSVLEVLLRGQVYDALSQRDHRKTEKIIHQIQRLGLFPDEASHQPDRGDDDDLTSEDAAILAAFIDRFGKKEGEP